MIYRCLRSALRRRITHRSLQAKDTGALLPKPDSCWPVLDFFSGLV